MIAFLARRFAWRSAPERLGDFVRDIRSTEAKIGKAVIIELRKCPPLATALKPG
jgi:hypothetical protein